MTHRAVFAIAFVASLASADGPDDARALVAEAKAAFVGLRYDDALRLLDHAWHRGDSSPEQTRAIFALAGQAAGSIGDEQNARLWFGRWLCLEPTAELAVGTSPKLTALFAAARTSLAGGSLVAHAVRHGRAVAITIANDPVALVDGVRLGPVRAPVHDGTASVAGPASSTVDLVDRYGNVLAVVPVHADVVVAPPPTQPSPWLARWTTWAVASGGFAVIAGGSLAVAIDARSSISDLNRASPNHEFSEAQALERRFDRAQLVADLAIGGAAIAAAVGGFLWMRGRTEPVSIAPTAHGATVEWGGSF